MQPAAPGHDKTDRVALRKGVGVDKKEAVNTERFWNLDESDVPPDQVSCSSMRHLHFLMCPPKAVFPSLFQS